MNPNAGPPPGMMATMIVCVGIIVVIALIIHVFFLLNLSRTLRAVREANREMSPGLVWLTIIPLFGSIWAVIMVPKISNSLEREFESRGRATSNEGFARTSGMIWAWGGILSIVLSLIQNGLQLAGELPLSMIVSLLSLPISIAILVCFILFWVQTYQYRRRLETEGAYGSDEERDYDDRYDRDDRRDDGSGRRDPDDDFDRDRPRRDNLGR